jgi:deazaflavin-dependent oxidoreductase (nitroreductase family)
VTKSPSKYCKLVFRTPVFLYRCGLGWLLGRRFLLLIHIGRRSGKRHETVLEIIEYRSNGPEAVVLSGFGASADWFRNVTAAAQTEVVIGIRRFTADHRVLEANEAVDVWARYERRHRLARPLIRLVLNRLLGWRYTGTVGDRQNMAVQLPMIELSLRS